MEECQSCSWKSASSLGLFKWTGLSSNIMLPDITQGGPNVWIQNFFFSYKKFCFHFRPKMTSKLTVEDQIEPDLTSLNFFLRGHLKSVVGIDPVVALKEEIISACNKISSDT